MKTNLLIVSFCMLIGIKSAQAQTIPFYPLHIGDRWEFSGKLSKVVKDTTIDSLNYSVIAHSDTSQGETRYERCDSGRVYRYNIHLLKEELWFDFTRDLGDTINVLARSDDTLTIVLYDTTRKNILGATRKVWHFYSVANNGNFYAFEIADSIGIALFLKIDQMNFRTDTPSAAFINGKLMRAAYPFIYLPFRPGNWWKFDDNPGMVSVVMDTLMPNGKTYALVLWGGSAMYFRQERHFLFRYNTESQQEDIEMDMSAPAGQIWDLDFWNGVLGLSVSEGIGTATVFSKNRRTYGYHRYLPDFADAWVSYAYADSFGIFFIGKMIYTELIEAQVDGQHYSLASVGAEKSGAPTKYLLQQNYPNPFNPTTRIDFEMPRKGNAIVRIYDILGREIRKLIDAELGIGTYSVIWDGKTLEGISVSSGVYFYTLDINGNRLLTHKMLLTK